MARLDGKGIVRLGEQYKALLYIALDKYCDRSYDARQMIAFGRLKP